ncbi:MAG: peptidoglycan-binding protein [Geminicoccaceae bacterium]|jgi:curli biogenesis system outer membrane secretion channel CsgG/peptidoglycan hydrolase-like protein with peptidoglycan-binding domain|nr:peptidoglycan-binding protein [Geminicoccaceae bacterium]
MTGMIKSVARRSLAGALLLLAGCASPADAPVVSRPKTLPVRNFTSFSESLRCMDNLFARFGIRDYTITSAGLPDATGEISTGTKDMLISAISSMSVRSRAFRFVDFDQLQVDVNSLQNLIGFTDDFLVPNYYIRGAITQLDEGVIADSAGASIAGSAFSLGFSADQVTSVVSMDLNIGDLLTRQILPGISARNSISVTRTGRAGDAGGRINTYGLFLNIALNRAEGMHAAVRNLVELSTIEVLGKLTAVPYWRCLQIEQTNPAVEAQARQWFDAMSEREQVAFVQQALASQGLYDAPITGVRDEATKGAVARYQADNGLIADGRINFDLYASLIHQDLALGRQPDPRFGQSVSEVAARVRPNPLTLTLATPNGAKPVYQVNQSLDVTAIASQDSYVYCYYQDGGGAVTRIFPNQFQPDAHVIAGRALGIPGEARFDIVFDRPGASEQVACLASPVEVGLRLPPQLKTPDLEPMPVRSLDEIVTAFRQLDSTSLVEARLPIRVQ